MSMTPPLGPAVAGAWRGALVALALVVGGIVGCGGSPTEPTRVPDTSPAVALGTRTFSGTVFETPGVNMELSLRIEAQSVRGSSRWAGLLAVLFAQEIHSVTGTYMLGTQPRRQGEVQGTFTAPSFLTAGTFEGALLEVTASGCRAERRYSGPITSAGLMSL